MPLRVKQTESPTQKKIRELVERTPVVKWIFPSLSEEVRSGEKELDLPTAVGMMGPAPVGLTKLGGAKQIVEPFLKKVLPPAERVELLKAIQFWFKTPKKVRKLISSIKTGEESAAYNPFSGEIHLSQSQPDFESTIHEVFHAVQDRLLKKRGKSMSQIVSLGQGEKFEPLVEDLAFMRYKELMGQEPIHSIRDYYRMLSHDIGLILKSYRKK